VEVMSDRTCRVELANGHRLLGFVAGRAPGNLGCRAIGDRVWVELSPYDLSEGRILAETPVK